MDFFIIIITGIILMIISVSFLINIKNKTLKMIRKIVAGNSIYIKWTVRKNDSILKDNLSVKLYDVFRKECAITYEIEESEDNKKFIINITYPGKNQFTFGKYSLVLFNNVDDVKQNRLVFKDAFILVHALKNRIICYGDELVDDTVLIEIDSDLNIALQNQEIQDKTQILEKIVTLDSSIQDLKDELDNIQEKIDFSGINSSINILDSSVNYIIDDVSEIQGSLEKLDSSFNYMIDGISEIQGSLDNLWEKIDYFSDINSSINILDNSVNYIINDIEKTEKTLVKYFTIIDNSVNMLMNTSMNSTYDDTSLTNYLNNVSTRVNNLSTNQDQLETYIINDRKHIIENENNISEISTVKIPTINTSINDLSTFMARLDASLQILWNSSQN